MKSKNSTKNCSIETIIVISDFNVRANELDQAKVAEYAEMFTALPPVSLFLVDRKPYLVDGWHRLAAAEKLGLKSIPACIVGKGTLVDAQDAADAANLTHGIALTPPQRRSIALRITKRHPDWPLRKVADMMGCHASTIMRWRDDAAVVANATSPAADTSRASAHRRASGVDIKVVEVTFREWYNRATDQAPMDEWTRERLEAVKSATDSIVDCNKRVRELLETAKS